MPRWFISGTRRATHYVRDSVPKVAVECREVGLGWLCKEPGSHVRRRIHDVVVWGVFDAYNYDYIIEYTFHEDGGISFRDGATGYNLPGGQSKPHVHNPFWRVSTKLFNRTDNQAFEFVHVEDSNGYIATDSEQPIPTETKRGLGSAEIQQHDDPECNPDERLWTPDGL